MTDRLDEPAPPPGEREHPTLRTLCETRQRELKDALGYLAADGSPQTRRDIEAALDALDELLTGNLDQIPPVVAAQLSKWIASSKYLGTKETREHAAALPPTPEASPLTESDGVPPPSP